MKKLVKSLTLTLLLASCVKPATAPLIEPCRVTRLPGLHLETAPCGDFVCLDVSMAVALAIWINDVVEYRKAVGNCPYVTNA